jgi:hypothetical protein
MMMHLGKNQRERLTALGCPSTAQVAGCEVTRSLAKRGLLRSEGDGFCLCARLERYRIAFSWMEDQDPQLVDAAREKFFVEQRAKET